MCWVVTFTVYATGSFRARLTIVALQGASRARLYATAGLYCVAKPLALKAPQRIWNIWSDRTIKVCNSYRFWDCWQAKGLEGGGGLIAAGESSKSSDMLYSKASSSDAKEELISASASDSRDCKILFSNGGRTAIGKSSMSTEVGLAITEGFNADLWVEILSFVVIELGTSR
ncbi:hypothetical protein AVEN_242111-1 [Araneus ventricosus]|uniref:Uncharacterized protein n=1 Tax=Araneus ventricosus TaxID=182803 RepID=A0A4Y2P6L5_ARAVE|nr:hypothetical protein AVEN_242111-1 [Araneus ventricosus]